jgi:hypothetical protein
MAMRAPTVPAKIGQLARSTIGAVAAAPLGLAEDIIEPATRFMRPLTDGAVEAGRVAVTGENPLPAPSVPAAAPAAARNPNQTAATQARTGVNLRNVSMQGGRGVVNPETVGQTNAREDTTSRFLAPGTTGQLPKDLSSIEAGKIYKTVDPKTGNPVYSGRDVGADASMVDGSGREIKQGGSVSVVPGMDRASLRQALTNPDGSQWTGADNSIMAANMRDGVNPYRGTSRAPQLQAEADARDLRALALSPLGTPGRTPALKLLTEQAQQETLRRGQDLQAGTATASNQSTLRAAQIKAISDEAKAQREQGNADRTFLAGRDDARANQEGRRRDDKRASADAFAKRISTMVGVGEDGKPDMATAATVVNGANAFLDSKRAEIEAILAKDPRNAKALALREDIDKNGLDSIDESTLRKLILGQKANRIAEDEDGWFPWNGTAVKTDVPVTELSLKRNMIFPNQYITNNKQVLPASAVEDNPDLRRLIVQPK